MFLRYRHKNSLALLIVFFFLNACGELVSAFDPNAAGKLPQPQKQVASKKAATEIMGADSDAQPFLDRAAITTGHGTYYFVKQGDSLKSISKKYGYTEDEVAQINDLYDGQLLVGRRIFFPAKKFKSLYITETKSNKEKKVKQSQNTKGQVAFIWPVNGGIVTSRMGMRRGRPHDGIDISIKTGSPVYAVADGKVIFARRFAGYGNLVVIKHEKDYFTAYAHAENIVVTTGKKVKQGQQIATAGSTGHSTGPHVHFEVRKKTQPIDPLSVLPPKQP